MSELVYPEAACNLAANAPTALPVFELFRMAEAAIAELTAPPKPVILRVAAALHARVQFLASYDRKHLLAQAAILHEQLGLVVMRPDELLRQR